MFNNENELHRWLENTIDQLIADGYLEAVGVDAGGDILYQVTEQGRDVFEALERQAQRVALLQQNHFNLN